MTTAHWLFGDQLGPHFTAHGNGGPGRGEPLIMIESRAVFRRRRFHRAKAHLVLSAMRHRAAELGDRVRYVRCTTRARHNPRTAQAVHGLDRLTDLGELLRQERRRGDGPP